MVEFRRSPTNPLPPSRRLAAPGPPSRPRRRRRPSDTARLFDQTAARRLPGARGSRTDRRASSSPSTSMRRRRAAEISMPVLDGFGLAAGLQVTNERTRELPLIFLTTEDDPLIGWQQACSRWARMPSSQSPSNPTPVTSFIERVIAQVVPRRYSPSSTPRARRVWRYRLSGRSPLKFLQSKRSSRASVGA